MLNEILLSCRSLRRHRLSFFLTVLSMAIEIASVIMISSVSKSSKETVLQCVESVGMKGLMYTHTTSFLDGEGFDQRIAEEIASKSKGRIRAMPFSLHVKDASLAGTALSVTLWGVGPHLEEYVSSRILYGRMLNDAEFRNAERVAVISEDVAQRVLGRKNAVGQSLRIGKEGSAVPYRVVGVIESETGSVSFAYSVPSFVYVPSSALSRYNGVRSERLIVQSDSLSNREMRSLVNQAVRESRGSSFHYEITDFDEGSVNAARIADVMTDVMTFSSGISLAVAGIGIMSTLLASVTARKEEIGLLKALGATDLQVAFCYLTEALLIAFCGVAAGTAGSFLLLTILFRIMRLPFMLNGKVILISSILAGLTGLFFGLLPAMRAARADPIDALRSV